MVEKVATAAAMTALHSCAWRRRAAYGARGGGGCAKVWGAPMARRGGVAGVRRGRGCPEGGGVGGACAARAGRRRGSGSKARGRAGQGGARAGPGRRGAHSARRSGSCAGAPHPHRAAPRTRARTHASADAEGTVPRSRGRRAPLPRSGELHAPRGTVGCGGRESSGVDGVL
jgi:hypothetical protein